AVLAEWEAEAAHVRDRLRQMDRRLDEQLVAAGRGRITREQLGKLSVATASQRLTFEDELENIEHKLRDQANATERAHGRQRTLAKVLDGWDSLQVTEKQPLLRELIDKIVIRDEGFEVLLRP
ncbi:MAG: hypothetical protein J4N26_04950, partial [Chloroflexi bacterium]|nr:hypothetical protein [Chloroflexota bacterium]